jgi:hypothetical protein
MGTMNQLIIASDLAYLDEDVFFDLKEEIRMISLMLIKLRDSTKV